MLYFAYGSNLDQEQMRERCPDSKLVGKAVLKNYKLDFDIFSSKRGGGCADIIPSSDDEVWGLLYELTEQDMKKLDAAEGVDGGHYRRIVVTVEDNSERILEVQTYEAVDKKPFIKPTRAYLAMIKTGARQFNFPESYRKELERVPFAE